MTEFLSIEHFEKICFVLAQKHLAQHEVIPPFSLHDHAKLDAALHAPKRTYDGKLFYPTLSIQSAVLFYEIIKQHALMNGNKRLAVMSLLVLLYLNNKWLEASTLDVYHLAVSVASSDSKQRDNMIHSISAFIEKHLTNA